MKKLLLLSIVVAASLPVAVFADHLRGTWGGWTGSHINFSVGNQHHSFGHGGHVPFVNEHGAAVDYHTLQTGHPITVHYSGRSGHQRVSKVVVHKQRSGHRSGHRR